MPPLVDLSQTGTLYRIPSIRTAAANVNELRFYLDLSPEQYLHYYRGTARAVSVRSLEGKRVQFPADRLRPFVTHEGVRGLFALRFDENHRFVALRRIGDLPPE